MMTNGIFTYKKLHEEEEIYLMMHESVLLDQERLPCYFLISDTTTSLKL